MRTGPRPSCHVCGSPGKLVYAGLRDRLFFAPGEWRFARCPAPDCGLLWLDPRPLAADLHVAYPSPAAFGEAGPSTATRLGRLRRMVSEGYMARHNVRAPGGGGPARELLGLLMYLRPLRRAELDAMRMHLRTRSGGRLLDIGCGRGDILAKLARAGWRAEGLDVDPAAVDIARGRGLDVRLGDLREQAYPTSSVDAVTLSHSIEHVTDPASLLVEIHRILTPRGRVAILTPNSRSLGHRWFRSSWLALDPPRHLHIFALPALCALLHRAGLRVLRATTSARDAEHILGASQSIFRTGRAESGRPTPWVRAARRLEWAARGVGAEIGEELVVIAEKPPPR